MTFKVIIGKRLSKLGLVDVGKLGMTLDVKFFVSQGFSTLLSELILVFEGLNSLSFVN